jgi:hypothetical protein
METETQSSISGRKITFIILISIIVLFLAYYSIMSILGPIRKFDSMRNEFGAKLIDKNTVEEKILSDSAYHKMLKEKSFLQSRIVMAETDSIYLTVNLSDSTANIEISGVVVHTAKMSEVKISRILMNGDENVIFSMLASPFTIADSRATIKKEPVMIKMAPRDTSEYKPAIMPDTSITEPVNYILEMTDGTRIYIYQEENSKPGDSMSQFRFDLQDRVTDTWNSLKSVFVFKVPEYHPFIKMKLPRADAKIIYRALPKNGQVAVFW